MAKIEIIGYHTTSRQNAGKILASRFEANLTTNDDWLGEGIYFWDDIGNAEWWKTAHFKGNSDVCILWARMICEDKEYIDLSIAKNMSDLLDFVREFADEMKASGEFCPEFKTPNQMKHFYCTAFKRRYQIKLMRHTFEHRELNVAGFQVLRPQLCATDATIIYDVANVDQVN